MATMLNAAWKVLAVLALAQGLDAKSQVERSAALYRGQHVVHVLGANTAPLVDALEDNVHEVFRRSFNGGMTARVSAGQIDQLKNLGFEVNVVVDDVADHITHLMGRRDAGSEARNSTDPDAWFRSYHSYTHVFEFFDMLAATKVAKGVKQSWLKKKVIGKTWEKRPIYAFEIGNPKAKEAIYTEGGKHGGEWAGMGAVQYALRDWVNKYASGKEAKLFNDFRFIFVPLMNVDGYHYSYTKARLWRKNRRMNTHRNCSGVDLNRNYNGFDTWELDPLECSRYYGGPTANSEPETKAIVKYLEYLKKKHRMIAMFDVHSYAQYILYPPGYVAGVNVSNVEQLEACGHEMEIAMEKLYGKEYVTMNAAAWYTGYGGADDYWYDKIASGPWPGKKGIVYTIEVRPAEDDPIGFVLPKEELLPSSEEWHAGFKAAVAYVQKELGLA